MKMDFTDGKWYWEQISFRNYKYQNNNGNVSEAEAGTNKKLVRQKITCYLKLPGS